MTSLMKALGIDRLSLDERLQLIEDLQDDLGEAIQTADIPQSHREELDRRIMAQEAAPREGSSWEVVKARLNARFGELA